MQETQFEFQHYYITVSMYIL